MIYEALNYFDKTHQLVVQLPFELDSLALRHPEALAVTVTLLLALLQEIDNPIM